MLCREQQVGENYLMETYVTRTGDARKRAKVLRTAGFRDVYCESYRVSGLFGPVRYTIVYASGDPRQAPPVEIALSL